MKLYSKSPQVYLRLVRQLLPFSIVLQDSMYIGNTSAQGLHHMVYEIVDNVVDAALAGYCTEIEVYLNPDNSVTVHDNAKQEPTATAAYNLAIMFLKKQEFDKTESYLKEAIEKLSLIHI